MKADTDREWLEELIGEHGRMVYASAIKILGNPQDADDVYQDVFLKLLARKGRRLRKGRVENWGAFLRVAATRQALNLLRTRRRRMSHLSDQPIDEIPVDSQEDPFRSAVNQEDAQLLREALAEIKPRDAEVFALRHFGELTYEEIARETSLSTRQVGVILHRVRGKLEKLLEPFMECAPEEETPKFQVIGGKER